jgi:hypothetical protein
MRRKPFRALILFSILAAVLFFFINDGWNTFPVARHSNVTFKWDDSSATQEDDSSGDDEQWNDDAPMPQPKIRSISHQTTAASRMPQLHNTQAAKLFNGSIELPSQYYLEPSVKLSLLVMIGFVLMGGLVLAIALLLHPKTRLIGIGLIPVDLILLVLISCGLFFVASVPASQQPVSVTNTHDPLAETVRKSLEAAQMQVEQANKWRELKGDSLQRLASLRNSIPQLSQSMSSTPSPELINKIKQITEVESAHFVNAIGQAVAKAMIEGLKDNNAQKAAILPANSTEAPLAAAIPAGSVPNNTSLEPSPPANSAPPANPLAMKTESTAKPEQTNPAPPDKTIANNTPVPPNTAPVLPVSTNGSTAGVITADISSDKAEPGESTKTSSAAQRPDWVGKPPSRVGDSYQMCVTSGPYTTQLECEAKIPEAIQPALDEFVERYRGRDAVSQVHLSRDQIQHLIKTEWEEDVHSSVGPMKQIHLLLNFNQEAKKFIEDAINSNIFIHRVAIAGTGLIGLWLCISVVWGYLKMDLATKGTRRGRLQLAAVAAILTIVATILSTVGFLMGA